MAINSIQSIPNYYNNLSSEISYLQTSLDFQNSLPENQKDHYLIKTVNNKINILKAIKQEIMAYPSNTVLLVSEENIEDYSIYKG